MFANIVTTQCQPQDDRKFNTWYNRIHIPLLMKYKRLKAVTRYKVVAGPGQPVQYATVYYFATQKALGAFGPS